MEFRHDGLGANYVRGLSLNASVSFIGPSGKLRLYEPLPDKLYFFATGTGLAPFLAMFYRLVDIHYMGTVKLFAGFRQEADTLGTTDIDFAKRNLTNFECEIYYSQPSNAGLYKKGHVTACVDTNIDKSALYFVCGHPNMVAEVKDTLTKHGISEEAIIIEGFTRHVQ